MIISGGESFLDVMDGNFRWYTSVGFLDRKQWEGMVVSVLVGWDGTFPPQMIS